MKNTINYSIKSEALPLAILIAVIASSFFFYQRFPEVVPIHWNIAGQPDNWASKTMSAFGFPAIITFAYVLFLFLPNLDPLKQKYRQFGKTYHMVKNTSIVFFALIYSITGLNIIGYNLPVDIWIPATVGVFFIILGNYMGKIKINWFLGIKTPWTMSNKEVWNKTNRFGGKVFMMVGLLLIFTGFLPIQYRLWYFIALMTALLLGTIGYSYLVYVKEK